MCEIQGSHGGVEDGSFETPASTHPTTQHHIWKWGIFYPTHIQHYQDSSHILVSSLFLKISNVYTGDCKPSLPVSMALEETSLLVLEYLYCWHYCVLTEILIRV